MSRFVYLWAIFLELLLSGCHSKAAADDEGDAKVPAQVQVGKAVQLAEPVEIRAQAVVVADPRHVSRIASTEAQPVRAVLVRVGDIVSRGQVLALLAEDPQAKATAQQADIQLQAAKRALDREEALVRGGVEPQVNAEQARTQFEIARSQAVTAKSLLARMEANTRLQSPTAGVVTAVSAAVGQVTSPGADLIEVADPFHLQARLQVEPEDMAKIHPGQVLNLQLPNDRLTFSARLTKVSATLNPDTQLGEASAEFDSPHPALGIGRFLVARVTVGRTRALLVPTGALVHRDDGDKVYTMGSGKAQEISVARGSIFGDLTAVSGKLAAGATVVTTGAYELSDGDPIAIAAAASASDR